jgi:hypothetical protein
VAEMDIKFKAVMLMADTDYFELNMQVMSDILMSLDGSINTRRQAGEPQTVGMYSTNPDLVYADHYKFNRASGQQPLILALDAFMRHAFNTPLEITHFGKPA